MTSTETQKASNTPTFHLGRELRAIDGSVADWWKGDLGGQVVSDLWVPGLEAARVAPLDAVQVPMAMEVVRDIAASVLSEAGVEGDPEVVLMDSAEGGDIAVRIPLPSRLSVADALDLEERVRDRVIDEVEDHVVSVRAVRGR